MDRGLVDVEIVKKGDGSYEDGVTRSADDVKIRTKRGDAVWVSEKDVIAQKPNPETQRLHGVTQDEYTRISDALRKTWRRIYG